MTVPTASKTLDEVARRYSESRTFRAILDVYAELDDASRDMFDRYVQRLTEVLAEGGDTTKVTIEPPEAQLAAEVSETEAARDSAAQ